MKTLVLFSLYAAVIAQSGYYQGFKVYQFNLENEQQYDVVASRASNEFYDFWSAPNMVGLPTTVMVHPKEQLSFISTLDGAKIPYSVLIENVETTIKAERDRQNRAGNLEKGNISFTTYHRYSDIEYYIQQLANNYPDIVKLEHFQTTYDGRAMWLVKIGSPNINKPIILIDGGIHAREWISPAVVLYIIHQLVENTANRHLIENVDWYIIPVLNPDGYEYSHTRKRLWRLNRAPVKNARCKGTDLNRNFGYHWGEKGTTKPPCSEGFPGRFPFDQLESSGLRDVVIKHKERIKLYISFHSYSNTIIYPWGYTKNQPKDVYELQSLGEQVASSIAEVMGTTYEVGMTAPIMGFASGVTNDWVKAVGGVELSYAIELPGGGEGGFLLPASRILNVSRETFEGVKVYHSYIESKFVYSKFG